MKKIAYLFPGQGAQYVGMGKDLYDNYKESRVVFDEAESTFSDIDIKRLCFEGPIEELTRTSNSQICILIVSIAAYKAFSTSLINKKDFELVACAGLSLGELTALTAAGSMDFKDAIRLVRRRGELMEQASLKNPGAMASLIGLPDEELSIVCKETGAEVANLNCPGQTVISGSKDSINKALSVSVEKGAKKAIPLNVSGAFHSSLMKEAAELFKIELDKTTITPPKVNVVSNVTTENENTPEEIKANLFKQLFSPVRWEASVRNIMSKDVDTFFEIGPGKVLKGLLRRIDKNLIVYNIEKAEDIDNFTTSNL